MSPALPVASKTSASNLVPSPSPARWRRGSWLAALAVRAALVGVAVLGFHASAMVALALVVATDLLAFVVRGAMAR